VILPDDDLVAVRQAKILSQADVKEERQFFEFIDLLLEYTQTTSKVGNFARSRLEFEPG